MKLFKLAFFLLALTATAVFAQDPPPPECDAHGGHGGNEPVIIIVDGVPQCILFCENYCFSALAAPPVASAKPTYTIGFSRYQKLLHGVTLIQLSFFSPQPQPLDVDDDSCSLEVCK